jgi:hypothetical protein
MQNPQGVKVDSWPGEESKVIEQEGYLQKGQESRALWSYISKSKQNPAKLRRIEFFLKDKSQYQQIVEYTRCKAVLIWTRAVKAWLINF